MKTILRLALLLPILVAAGCSVETVDDHGGLPAPVIEVDDSNFEEAVLASETPVLVDFYATWCGPCKEIAPIVDDLAFDYEGRAVVARLDVDQAQETAFKYEVVSIPTLIVFSEGKEVSRVVGTARKSKLASLLDKEL